MYILGRYASVDISGGTPPVQWLESWEYVPLDGEMRDDEYNCLVTRDPALALRFVSESKAERLALDLNQSSARAHWDNPRWGAWPAPARANS